MALLGGTPQEKNNKKKQRTAVAVSAVLAVVILAIYIVTHSPYTGNSNGKDPALTNLGGLRGLFQNARVEANLFVAPVEEVFDDSTQQNTDNTSR
jgi:hypothetical protein